MLETPSRAACVSEDMPYSPNVICLERYHVCDVVITARTKEDLSIQAFAASIACQELWDERDMDEGTR
jgi:hypothetical protein